MRFVTCDHAKSTQKISTEYAAAKPYCVVFALEYAKPITQELIAQKEILKEQCVLAVSQLPGVNSVKIAITSPAVEKTKSDRFILPGVGKVIAIASGKGGVGKSTVAANLAITLMNMGYRVGLLDADIYGPSLPRLLGIKKTPVINNNQMVPLQKYGLQLMSIGFLLDEADAAVWRGPMVSKALHQMMYYTAWKDLDYLLVDTPPGTGDIHLSLAGKYNIDGAIVVLTPQQLAYDDARRGISMFYKLGIAVLGVIENMSYLQHEGKKIEIFGSGMGHKFAQSSGVAYLGEIPIVKELSLASDSGKPPTYFGKNQVICEAFNQIASRILS
jgi:ATP-binding protein involved in chromosome partitioning